ncbi:MAG: hypothetical protein ACKVP5_21120 [Aestuariivirga sp.]
MHKKIAALLLLLPATVAEAGERKLTGSEIRAVLEDHVFGGTDANGKAWSQIFQKAGATFYMQDSSVSNGSWDIRGDQYCSQWPPSQTWSCYDVVEDDGSVVFISSSGNRYPSRRQN